MDIQYYENKEIGADELLGLFNSVKWSSGKYPERLKLAISNFPTVYSAWNNNHLIGLICVMDDGHLNAYIPYLLVHPIFQNNGIGATLINKVKLKYTGYKNVLLISYKSSVEFYEKMGFETDDDSIAMFIK